MQNDAYDHLVIGSTPLAGLVAGLLARDHGKRVCLVREPYSPFGLEQHFDLSVDLVTRPETLALLKRLSAETLKLIGSIGKHLVDRIDPLFIAESRAGMDALGHFLHLAQALDYPAERVADRNIAEGGIIRVRGQSVIAHHRFSPALEAWLDRSEVRRLDPADTGVTLHRDGTATIESERREVGAQQVLLADDRAVLTHLALDTWDRSVVRSDATALLLQPAKPLPHPLKIWLDRGVTLRQEPRGSLSAIAVGDRATAEARIAASAMRALPLRRAGIARFETLSTADGAPLLAPARGMRLTHLAGFGLAGAFYAPAIARQLAGKTSADEAAWFAARGATRGNLRLNAAEYA